MLNPVWVARLHITGPRDNRHFPGFPSAFVWVAGRAPDVATLTQHARETLATENLKLTATDRLQQITDRIDYPLEVHTLIREAAARTRSSSAIGAALKSSAPSAPSCWSSPPNASTSAPSSPPTATPSPA